jgi:hypothetical protein
MHQHLSKRGRDRITGREVIITAYLIHASGFEQVMLVIDGELENLWFDVNQITVLPPIGSQQLAKKSTAA